MIKVINKYLLKIFPLLFGIIIGYFVIGKYIKEDIINDYSVELYRANIDLQCDGAKANLVEAVDNYIQDCAPMSCLSGLKIVEASDEYNIDIIFILAQGEIESHFGTRGVAFKTNSVFNVFSYDGVSAAHINKSGRGYKHPDDSVIPYLKLLKTHYLVNGKAEEDMFNKFINSAGKRYASDPNYESKLFNKYTKIKSDTTYNIYPLCKKYNKYKILTGRSI